MIIVTWNINSLRLRLAQLKTLVELKNPDIIALQEIKVCDADFPHEQIKDLGFPYIAFAGEKSYNGVAILSKIAFSELQILKFAGDASRHVAVKLISGLIIHNFYIPAGGDEPDVDVNPKFANKLQYLDEMTAWFLANHLANDPIILLGDLNIAPYENDVWSHKQLLDVVSHTKEEIDKFLQLKKTLSFVDVGRMFVPLEQKLYSWWSYRNRAWRKSDRGRRLDHILVTKAFSSAVNHYWVLKDARDWISPSDHVPVGIEIKNYTK